MNYYLCLLFPSFISIFSVAYHLHPSVKYPESIIISNHNNNNCKSRRRLYNNSPTAATFSIDDYLSESWYKNKDYINAKYSDNYPLLLNEKLVENSNNDHNSDNNAEHIILVDLSIRSIDDINISLTNKNNDNKLNIGLNEDEGWESFKKKSLFLKETYAIDKFLYSHDIGTNTIKMISVARIPINMFEKLDLSRKLAETHNNNNLFIHVITQFGEYIIDESMTDALLTGFQSKMFTLPSFKNTKNNNNSNNNGNKKEDKLDVAQTSSINMTFLTGNNNLIQDIDSNDNDSDSSNNDNNNNNKEDKKISSLLEAMNAAAKTNSNYNINEDDSNNNFESTNDSNNNYNYKINNSQLIKNIENTKITTAGTNLVRALSFLPPNVLTTKTYANVIHNLSKQFNFEVTEWDTNQLSDIGCGAFCAVTKGNNNNNDKYDRLFRLKYNNNNNNENNNKMNFIQTAVSLNKLNSNNNNEMNKKRPIVLVGKGVCFDTGGLNIKSANSMKTMKLDMAGSAVALAVFLSLIEMDILDCPIECWMGIVENNIDSNSFRPDDVVVAVTGDSIEIVNTDAEGRLILADILALATRKVIKPSVHSLEDELTPKLVLDFATLTGTCITSLSNRYIGVFSNRMDEISQLIINSGIKSGERCWPFPCDNDFEDDLKSDVADILQCRQPVEADHIYAFSFLKKFVHNNVPWIHCDLGSAHRPGGLGAVGSDYTGAGVRLALEIIRNYLKIK